MLLLGLVREASFGSAQSQLTAETHNWPKAENNLLRHKRNIKLLASRLKEDNKLRDRRNVSSGGKLKDDVEHRFPVMHS